MADSPWTGITNLGALDQKLYSQPPPEPAQTPAADVKQEKTPLARTRKPTAPKESPFERPQKHLVPKSTNRPFIRRTFDLYEDQVAYLTRASLQERLDGNDISMNSMIREAVDDWIKKRTAKK